MRRFACQLPIEKARRWYELDDSEGARVRPAIRDCSLLLQRYCSASCKEKAMVIDPLAISICLLDWSAKGGFLGCRGPGLRISIDGHDATMRELARFIDATLETMRCAVRDEPLE